MQIKKAAEAINSGAPTAVQLEAINTQAKAQLTAEQVYVFSLRLCDDQVDRDFERFDTAALGTLAKLFIGKTGVVDHKWSASKEQRRICLIAVAALALIAGMRNVGGTDYQIYRAVYKTTLLLPKEDPPGLQISPSILKLLIAAAVAVGMMAFAVKCMRMQYGAEEQWILKHRSLQSFRHLRSFFVTALCLSVTFT